MAEDQKRETGIDLYAGQKKYIREKTRRMTFNFVKTTDADIIEKLESVDNRMGYIKRLIREDIERSQGMKHYKVLDEYLDKWTSEYVVPLIVTEDEIQRFAKEWDVPVSTLMEQVEEV